MTAARNYAVVTGSYLAFTITDGAIRMLVLLHFYQLGYTPFMLAFLFLLYETAGIFANLGGGWLALRFGIPRMLAVGIALQIGGLLMLSALDPGWSAAASVTWVVLAQGIAGVAKDLTKTASKSAIKASAQQGAGQLFRWVAWFTGSKNATKGRASSLAACCCRSSALPRLVAAGWVAGLQSRGRPDAAAAQVGQAKSSRSMRALFAKTRAINLLAAARIFMFGSRDVWFVVGLPVTLYLYGWRYMQVAGFLALWTIGYGAVQALAPQLVARSADGLSREVPAARTWGLALAALPAVLAALLAVPGLPRPDLVVVGGLLLFGFAFAVLSSLHSYLILAYAGSEKVAEDVGFYYAANAAGRLLGILLSGLLTGYGGLAACLWGACAMLIVCLAVTLLLPTTAPSRQAVA